MAAAQEKPYLLVIGAGVIGLQCALTILESDPAKYQVSIVAEFLPGDEDNNYASAWAGAQWRSHETSRTREARWDVETYEHWQKMVDEGMGEEGGVVAVKAVNYWETVQSDHTGTTSDPWWSRDVRNYQRLPREQLPEDLAFGVSYQTFSIDVQTYLRFLRHKIEKLSGNLVQTRLSTAGGFTDALGAARNALRLSACRKFHAVINASGLQARDLVGDDSVFGVRGQTVKVRGVAKQCTTRLGKDKNDRTVIIPRPRAGMTIIGVSSEPGNSDITVDNQQTKTLLETAKPFCTELLNARGNFDIISAGVGIRPGRKDGPRIELEYIEDVAVIHAYGVAGGGYQNSIGISREVLQRLQTMECASHLA